MSLQEWGGREGEKNEIGDFHLINTTSRLLAINRTDLSDIETAYSGDFRCVFPENVIDNVEFSIALSADAQKS